VIFGKTPVAEGGSGVKWWRKWGQNPQIHLFFPSCNSGLKAFTYHLIFKTKEDSHESNKKFISDSGGTHDSFTASTAHQGR